MNPIRLGIIGAGSIAQTAHLPVVSRMTDFQLVGICDTDRAKARSVAEHYRMDVVSSDYNEFLERPDIDAVIVATTTDTHHPIGLAALAANKHVLIEKPLARTYKEAVELSNASATIDRVLMVGMNHRFRQDSTTLKNLIRHGELGQIYMVNAGWLNYQSSAQSWLKKRERAGGGVLIDLGIVMIDLVLWLMDFPKVQSVSSTLYHHKTKGVEDSASCFFRLENDASVSLSVSWSATLEKQQYYLDIIGSKGSASVNPLVIHKLIAGAPVNVTPVLPDSATSIFRRSYEHELRHFAGAIRKHHPVISTAEEAARRMKLVDAAYKSAQKKKEVLVP